jgi:transcriptional regulator with XRE-family HTH domain
MADEMTKHVNNQSKAKAHSPIDVEVGARIRTQRRVLGMSQSTLAEAMGVTFQQVQKYEKGTNRVGASRLLSVTNVLGVPVSYFFDSQSRDGTPDGLTGTGAEMELSTFLETDEGRDLNVAFARIARPALRRQVLSLVKAMAATDVKGSRGNA